MKCALIYRNAERPVKKTRNGDTAIRGKDLGEVKAWEALQRAEEAAKGQLQAGGATVEFEVAQLGAQLAAIRKLPRRH